MKKTLLAAAVFVLFAAPAHAQERFVDGLLGGVSGALVAGPVGLVAGTLVGVTAGPAISSSWGLSGHRRYRRYRRHY
jgi:hypothetical protein